MNGLKIVEGTTPKIPEGMELVLGRPKPGDKIWVSDNKIFRMVGPTERWYHAYSWPILVPKADNPYGMSFEDAVAKWAPGREMERFGELRADDEYLSPNTHQIYLSNGFPLQTQTTKRIILKPKPKKVLVTVELTTVNSVVPGLEVGHRTAVDSGEFGFLIGRVIAIEVV